MSAHLECRGQMGAEAVKALAVQLAAAVCPLMHAGQLSNHVMQGRDCPDFGAL